jgi:hypothetical protein
LLVVGSTGIIAIRNKSTSGTGQASKTDYPAWDA